MILLVVIAVSAVGWLSYRSLEQALLPRILDRVENHSKLLAADLQSYVRGARADVTTFRSRAAANGIVTAHLNGGIDPVDHVSEARWRQRLQRRMSAEVAAKPAYSEFRFIGIEDGGREIIRIDRSGPNGAVRVAPDSELKQTANERYFNETLKAPANDIYVSPVELNRENGVLETPHVPTLRIAAPFYAPDGKLFGIVVINVDMRPVFARIRVPARPGEQVYVVSPTGDYLVHPDPRREFGSQLGKPAHWQADFPYFAHLLNAAGGGARIVADQDGRAGGAALAPAVLAGKQWLGIIETVPNSVFTAVETTIRNTALLVGLVATLFAGVVAVFVARSLTRPILRLTAAVEGLGRSNAPAIPVDAGGETGVLARAFARAIGEANAQAAALEERRRIFETSQDLIVVLDARGHIVQISPSCETILGYRPEEVTGRGGVDFIHSDDLAQAREEMRAARRGQRNNLSDTRCIHKDGREVWLSWLGTWSEPVKRYFFVGRDMTESRYAQETLRESAELSRGIINTSLDAFIQMNDSGTITDWNSQAEKVFGWSRSEAIGQKLGALIVPERHRTSHTAGLQRFLRSGEAAILGRRVEIDALRRDGTDIKVELSITELRRRDGFLFNAFVRDLTDKIAAEERIRQSEKMEAIGQLTGGIAHDFNNILTVITGTIEILATAVADQPQLTAITKMIDEAAARGADLTQHLLAFARRQPLQPRETDTNLLIVDTAKLLRPTLGEHIEIELLFKDDPCIAIVDPNQLATAIINLALNSRDAMPDGGKLILETGLAYLDEAYASMNEDVRPGAYAMIAVSDTGHGIPAAILDRVFDPFFTSKGPGKGTGLGLSMVYGFIKQSAGHIKVYSEEGQGTTIRMYLPPGSGTLPATGAETDGELQGGHETILVVEDDRLVRDYVLTQLRTLGYATLDAANAVQALALVAKNPGFDLLFTDVIMPGSMNGRQLADAIRKDRPDLKVLYTSGYTEDAIVHHGRLDSGVLLLAKPYRKSDLARMIRRALEG
ncbi:MAG TPA: PAS domain S-box protein [Bradyrhizobium sp.]|nr:PAS domain S-box protein [Bradyrhizobium sp.]HLZ04659.1 PAS domain S-box protein [Bradyrhizobium sp.]